jgi:hypothetical protein
MTPSPMSSAMRALEKRQPVSVTRLAAEVRRHRGDLRNPVASAADRRIVGVLESCAAEGLRFQSTHDVAHYAGVPKRTANKKLRRMERAGVVERYTNTYGVRCWGLDVS